MLSRALAPILVCASAIWPLRALACINTLDGHTINFHQPLWLDLLLWTVGAVFLNRVVIVNVLGPDDEDAPRPSWFRRSFFLLVGASLVLLLATVLAGGPLLGLGGKVLAICTSNRFTLLLMMASPAILFVLQTVFFQGAGKRVFGDKGGALLFGLVFTSVVLALGMGMARDAVLLPALCTEEPLY